MADHSRIDDLRRRIQNDPASIAFAQLAEEYRRVGRYEDAVDICRRGLQGHPGYLSARVTLARALLQVGQIDEAQSELQQVLHTAPQNLAAVRGLAEIHQRRGRFAEAMAQYRVALSLAPNDPELERTISDLSQQLARSASLRDRDRARSHVSALEQWLAALHVTRAQRSA